MLKNIFINPPPNRMHLACAPDYLSNAISEMDTSFGIAH
jgi:hypothetical protein